ncbi:Thiosulfate sulfurtransferase rdl2, mitochondrial [Marasmius crinis-equi]|uniref:Thiosulfate sulfurtransferase rdl2, mitochondrial n=1 Tax=Marasmius crinis-equi TaxID=585013 RepID=A0ABR3FI62_9AGAR
MFRSSLSTVARPVALSATRSQATRSLATAVPTNDANDTWGTKIITYDQLKPKLKNPDPNAVLIDLREPDEVVHGMIPNAVHLPITALADLLYPTLSPAEFKAKHGFTKPEKSQEILFYCKKGKRSAIASEIAERNGYKKIYDYSGSWLEWIDKEGLKQSIKAHWN